MRPINQSQLLTILVITNHDDAFLLDTMKPSLVVVWDLLSLNKVNKDKIEKIINDIMIVCMCLCVQGFPGQSFCLVCVI